MVASTSETNIGDVAYAKSEIDSDRESKLSIQTQAETESDKNCLILEWKATGNLQ